MAKLPSSFNDADASDEFPPAGEYLVEIVKSDMKETKSGTGQYLAVQFKILEGKNKGSIVFNNYNIINDNEVAVKIAIRELDKLCAALGKKRKDIIDSSQLHAIPFIIVLELRPADDAYPGNVVKGYKPYGKVSQIGAVKKNPFANK